MCDVSDSQIAEVYQQIRNDKNATNWLLLGYEGNNKIVLQGKGEGGLAELGSQFANDQSQYAYLRVVTGDNESKRTKFVFLSWCGESVGALKRAKMSVHKADVKKVLREYAIEIHATLPAEVDEEEIMKKVKKAGGADYSGSLTSSN